MVVFERAPPPFPQQLNRAQQQAGSSSSYGSEASYTSPSRHGAISLRGGPVKLAGGRAENKRTEIKGHCERGIIAVGSL